MNRVNEFLKDLSYSSKYQFLDIANADHQKEIKAIAEKRGILLPSHDLSIFKCVYAFTDRANKNGCTLPKEEVSKSLETLVGKAIDFDHIRKRVVGYWVDAELKDGTIFAWGIFFKGNFGDDYDLIKSMLEKDLLSISFEAWGQREFTDGQNYSLKDIEFAGGALLLKSEPAFDGANVLEMANKNRVLEFASVLKAPELYLHKGSPEDIEKGRFFLGDFEAIVRMLMEASCPVCNSKFLDIQAIDFEGSTVGAFCVECSSRMRINMTPQPTLASIGRKIIEMSLTKVNSEQVKDLLVFAESYVGTEEAFDEMLQDFDGETIEGKKISTKERNALSDDKFALIQTVKNKKTGKDRKIRRFPIHDENHVRNALARLPQAKNLTSEEKDMVMKKIMKRARELNMKDLLAKYEKATVEEQAKLFGELAKANTELTASLEKATTKATEDATAYSTLKKEFDEMKVKFDAASVELNKIAEEAKAKKLAERKTALGEFAKDMKDEDILDDAKYENATLKMEKAKVEKENEELKKGKVVTDPTMNKGSKDKLTTGEEALTIGKSVIAKAYPAEKK